VVSQLSKIVLAKAAAEGRKITQRQIAKETGVLENTVSRWMTEEPFIKIESKVATALCAWAKCELGDLLVMRSVNTK